LAAVEAGGAASRKFVRQHRFTRRHHSANDFSGDVRCSMPSTTAAQGIKPRPNESKSPCRQIVQRISHPGGFLDFTTFYRSTNVGSGIATAFGSIPFSNQLPQGACPRRVFSAQYSRLSLTVDTV